MDLPQVTLLVTYKTQRDANVSQLCQHVYFKREIYLDFFFSTLENLFGSISSKYKASYKMHTSPSALLQFTVDFRLCWRVGGWGRTLRCFAICASHALVPAPDYRRRAR